MDYCNLIRKKTLFVKGYRTFVCYLLQLQLKAAEQRGKNLQSRIPEVKYVLHLEHLETYLIAEIAFWWWDYSLSARAGTSNSLSGHKFTQTCAWCKAAENKNVAAASLAVASFSDRTISAGANTIVEGNIKTEREERMDNWSVAHFELLLLHISDGRQLNTASLKPQELLMY